MTTRAHAAASMLLAIIVSGGCGGSSDAGGSTDTGAGSGDSGVADGPTSAADSTGGPAMQWPPGETAGLAESCVWHDDCVSWYCRRHADAPADPDAACAETPPWGAMVVTGNIRDLRTRAPVGNVGVRVISAFAAVANPATADALAETTASADGRFEVTAEGVGGTPLGIVATIQAEGYYLTATALAGPIDDGTDYFPGNDIHDMWVIPEADVTAFSEMLAGDPLLASYLPLGEKGGSIGIVRDEATGEPIAGAVVQSEDGVDSAAYIRYLDDAEDAFGSEATGASGLFVIVNADLAESFEALVDGERIGSNVAGSAEQSVLAVSIQ